MRSVERLDKNTGDILGLYDSVTEALEWLKENRHIISKDISSCCRGKRKTTGGFKWRYHVVVDLPNEKWKEIPGCTDYWVSNEGRVKYMMSLKQQSPNDEGYKQTKINGKMWKVSILEALAFIPNPKNLPDVDHIDKDKSNNKLSNLRWLTHKDNVTHSLGKSVAKCDMDGNVIETFRSIKEAARSLGKTVSPNISLVCNGTPRPNGRVPIQACGFRWKFVD